MEGVRAVNEAPDPENPGRNIPPELAKTHRAIALDLPGYGLSDKPLDVTYDHDFFADVLLGFLDALDIRIPSACRAEVMPTLPM